MLQITESHTEMPEWCYSSYYLCFP